MQKLAGWGKRMSDAPFNRYAKYVQVIADRVSVDGLCVQSPLPHGESNWEHRWICAGNNCDCPECPAGEEQ